MKFVSFIWSQFAPKSKKLNHFGVPLTGFTDDFIKYVMPNTTKSMTVDEVVQKEKQIMDIRTKVESSIEVKYEI